MSIPPTTRAVTAAGLAAVSEPATSGASTALRLANGRSGTVVRTGLAAQVQQSLMRDIRSGRYPPHFRIVETRVARELGISQAPVREALRALQALGVVDLVPFRGAHVRFRPASEAVEVRLVSAELESLAIRIGVPRATPEDLAELQWLVAGIRSAAIAGNRADVETADAAIHAQIIRMGGNRILEDLWRLLEPLQISEAMAIRTDDLQWITAQDSCLEAAVRAGRVDLAIDVIRQQLDHFVGRSRTCMYLRAERANVSR